LSNQNIIEYPKPGTARNPKRVNWDKRPERFVEPLYSADADYGKDIVMLQMWLRITKEEKRKISGLLRVIQDYFDSQGEA